MIFGNKLDFFVQTDILIRDGDYCMGPLVFWIDDKAYPGEGAVLTLNSEIMNLKNNLDKALCKKFPGSNFSLHDIDFEREEESEENIMYCYLSELGDYGLRMMCEIVEDKFRLFYSLHEGSFKLKEISLQYYRNIIVELFKFISVQSANHSPYEI